VDSVIANGTTANTDERRWHLTQRGQTTTVDAGAANPTREPDISVVAPFFNEHGCLERFVDELGDALAEALFELIAVDDGSTDGSGELMSELAECRPWLRILRLPVNRGQTAALAIGIAAARGPVIVTTDSDGQNDPRDIAALVHRLRTSGADAAIGRRVDRKEGIARRAVSGAANWFIRRAIGVHVHDTGCTLKAFRASAIKDVTLLRDDHRFLPILIAMRGTRVVEVAVRDRQRTAGRSHYGFSRAFGVLADLFGLWIAVRFRGRPIRAAGWCAIIVAVQWLIVGTMLLASRQVGLAAGAWSIGVTVSLLTFVAGAFAEQYLRFREAGYTGAIGHHHSVPVR